MDGETVTTHTATQDDMDAGGFEQNLTSKGLVSAPMWYVTAFTNYVWYPGRGLNCTGLRRCRGYGIPRFFSIIE